MLELLFSDYVQWIDEIFSMIVILYMNYILISRKSKYAVTCNYSNTFSKLDHMMYKQLSSTMIYILKAWKTFSIFWFWRTSCNITVFRIRVIKCTILRIFVINPIFTFFMKSASLLTIFSGWHVVMMLDRFTEITT